MPNLPDYTNMTVDIKGVVGMPTPDTKQAPHYDPEYPEELKDFFQEFEEHALACGLIDEEKARVVVRYTDNAMRRFWKSLEGFEEDYKKLKDNILNSYSKTQLGERFSVSELAKFIEKSAN